MLKSLHVSSDTTRYLLQDIVSPNKYYICNNKKGSFSFCVSGTIRENFI